MATTWPRWRPSSSSSPPVSSTSSPSSSFTADPPAEFLCPISGTLMADPVIVPPGQTFERACIQACAALAFSPPAVAADLSSLPSASSPLVLIPNVALRTAILNWCDRLSLPYPTPLSPDTAHDIVRRLMAPPPLPENEKRPQPVSSVRTRSHYGDEFAQQETRQSGVGVGGFNSMEEKIMGMLGAEDQQEAAMALLRKATRENKEVKRQLCTPRLLAALRPMLLSSEAGVQVNAAAALVNLSLEPENKVRIVRSGAVSPLVEVLKTGHPEARDHAAGAVYSLAVEDENRAAIGVLGAIPPLLDLFSCAGAEHLARREAGMALYHVSISGMNRSKIAAPGSAEEEYCISALYGMSRGSLRFRGLARAAGVEAVLTPVAEAAGGGVGRDMARRTLRAMRGEDDEAAVTATGLLGRQWDDGSVVSEGLVSIRRPPTHHRSNYAGGTSGSNTTQF